MTKRKSQREPVVRQKQADGISKQQGIKLWWCLVLTLFLISGINLLGVNDTVNTSLVSHPDLMKVLFPISHILLSAIIACGLLLSWRKRNDLSKWLILAAFILSAVIYLLSFNPQLTPNGDNAEYLIVAKSIVEEGAAYRLDTPTKTRNTLANIGLPLLLLPIFKIWGMSLLKMKTLIFLLAIACFPLLLTLFKRLENRVFGSVLALIAFSSPYLVANSSTIMTEVPYLFWSLATMIAAMSYARASRRQAPLGLLVILLGGITLLTRAPGISVLLSVVIFLFIQIPFSKFMLFNWKTLLTNAHFLKFCGISVPLLFALVIWQIKLSNAGISHANIITNLSFSTSIPNNFVALNNVWGQMLFSDHSFRWFRLAPDVQLTPSHIGFLAAQLLCFFGLVLGLIRRQLPAIYTLLMLVVTIAGSQTPQERVIARYLTILVPFLIYYLYLGSSFLMAQLSHRLNSAVPKVISSQIPFLLLFYLFLVGMSANHFNVRTKSPVHNEYYDSFLTAAKWCGENLPPDAYVMSVKPRIVYIMSGLKGTSMASERDRYDEAWAKKKIEEIRIKNVTHLIVDAISVTTTKNIYPLLQNNPDKFEPMAVPGLNDKCTIVRVKK